MAANKLIRARKRLLKQLAHGFERAVFSAPQGSELADEVIEGPGSETIETEALSLLFEQARDAAERGLVKHTWILSNRDQLNVDARHGFVKKRKHDPARDLKAMGGKQRALHPDASAPLLRALGIMKADGSIPAQKAKKYKQVNHLVELARPTLEHLPRDRALRIVDLACGNAYLSFVLAEALRLEGRDFGLLGVDLREELIARCRARAAELDWSQLRFESTRIEDLDPTELEGADLLLALHACDTATDAAILTGLRAGVQAMWIVPCCHAEVAAQLGAQGTGDTPRSYPIALDALLGEGLLRRAHAETLTDALRVEVLRACGFEVSLLEFVSLEHTPKNLLIRAHRRAHRHAGASALDHPAVREALEAIHTEALRLGVEPTLLAALKPRN